MKSLIEYYDWILKESSADRMIPNGILVHYFNSFHLSEKLLGDTEFTFTPRVPRYPIEDKVGNGWEDDFTPRISLAPSIGKALEAGATGLFVYAGNVSNAIPLEDKVDDCPGEPLPTISSMVKFHLGEYLESIRDEMSDEEIENIIALSDPTALLLSQIRNVRLSSLPTRIRNRFFLCVPDSKETKEKVSLEPVTLLFLGMRQGSGMVKLEDHAIQYLESKGITW